MTNPEPPRDHDDDHGPFIERTLSALDGQLGPDEQAALNAELGRDIEKRRLFVQLCLQSRALSEILGPQRQVALTPGDGEADDVIPGFAHRGGARIVPRRSWLPWSIAAAAGVIAALSLGLGARRERAVDRPPRVVANRPASKAAAVVALLVNEADARFAGNTAPRSVSFETGAYHLTRGSVHLRFTSGADVVIRAPARYLLHDPLRIALKEGILRAVVPESAHGFTVEAPGVEYVDLGTEFGVAVPAAAESQDRSESELHVFAGRVDLKTPGGRPIARVGLGESVHVVNGAIRPIGPAGPDRFPTPGTVGFERWNRWRETYRSDPALVAYYPFVEDPKDDRLLRDHAAHDQALPGRIHGARWVSGRWPGKQALLFDRDEDAVELTLPGEFRQLTLAAWVNIDRLDYELNAIFDSDGWGPGDFHWQLTRSREESAGIYGYVQQRMERVNAPVPLGQWVHLATVVDLDRPSVRAFVNGERVAETVLSRPLPALAPGRCRLGDWLRRVDWPSVPKRGLRGRIDEFAIWRRALGKEELRSLVTAGRPSLIHVAALGGKL